MERKRPISEKVVKDHNQVKAMYDELMRSHKLAYSFSRTAIYEELAEQTGYSERQIRRILAEH